MRWPWSSQPDYEWLDSQAEVLLTEPDKGTILNQAANDDERYRLCVAWAEKARDDFYAGRRATIAAVVASRDRKYRHYNFAVRAAIGERRWAISVQAKDLIALEQMYSRWASQYKAGPESRV